MTNQERYGGEMNFQFQDIGGADLRSKTIRRRMYEDESKLKELSALDVNWDGYGAEAPSYLALGQAGTSLNYSYKLGLYPDRITSSAEGGVALFCFTTGGYALIEFYNDGEAAAMTKKGGDENYWDIMDNKIEETLIRIKGFLDG